jgi:hypothetical protein
LRIIRHCCPLSEADLKLFLHQYLELLLDKNRAIRIAMVRAVAALVARSVPDESILKPLFFKLKPFTYSSQSLDVHETIYILLGELGVVLEGEYLLVVIITLIEVFNLIRCQCQCNLIHS